MFCRIWTYVRHFLTAWNTTGEGIHSPYLFQLVRFVIRDDDRFYCFDDVERRRAMLLACDDVLDVVDYGSKGSKEGTHVSRRVSTIAKEHLESAKMGQVLFRIVNFMGQSVNRPLRILELGTSLGVTTSYLALPNSRNEVVTLEGSGEVLRVAQGVWRALRLENIRWIEGNIDDTLFKYAREEVGDEKGLLDVAYIDANHTYEATMRYVQFLLPKISENGIIFVDDIHYSEGMERAWKELKDEELVTTSIDLYHMGLLFVNKCYLRRNYRVRV